jgi:hypothetical protein
VEDGICSEHINMVKIEIFVEGPGTCLEFECLVREMLVIDFKGISTSKPRFAREFRDVGYLI